MTTFRVIGPQDRVTDTSSGAMLREAAISGETVGAGKLWFGYVELAPGSISQLHHHGESESAIYIVDGTARFCVGDDLTDIHDASAGDFVWVPPFMQHIEMNASDSNPVRMVVARSTQQAIVVNLPTPADWSPPD